MKFMTRAIKKVAAAVTAVAAGSLLGGAAARGGVCTGMSSCFRSGGGGPGRSYCWPAGLVAS